MNYYRLAVNTSFNNSLLSYCSEEEFEIGDIVKVPLGCCIELGLVIEILEKEDNIEYKSIIEKVFGFLKSEEYFIQLIKLIA